MFRALFFLLKVALKFGSLFLARLLIKALAKKLAII